MSKIQETITKEQEKRNKRARAMVNDLVGMLKQCDKVTENISYWDEEVDYRIPYMAELDRQVKERLFECEERSWSMDDIATFLFSLENELEKTDKDINRFWKIMRKYNKNHCFDEDFSLCPFGLLYKAFLEIVFANADVLFQVSKRFLNEEAQKQSEIEARLKEEAESIVREAKAKSEITEDEKWQAINEKNWETAMNEARAEMEVIA